MDLYLRIANELYLKRLVEVEGLMEYMSFQKILEMRVWFPLSQSRVYQMELYAAYKDYEWMMDLVEEMVEKFYWIYMGKQKFG